MLKKLEFLLAGSLLYICLASNLTAVTSPRLPPLKLMRSGVKRFKREGFEKFLHKNSRLLQLRSDLEVAGLGGILNSLEWSVRLCG